MICSSAVGARSCLKAAYRLMKSSAVTLWTHPKLSQLWKMLFKLQSREATKAPYRQDIPQELSFRADKSYTRDHSPG